MKYAIETFDLTKKYVDFIAVDTLNFKIRNKSIFGFLGPNGAGKTTTIKMLTCLIEPTSGTANVVGHDILKSPNEVREKIGMVPQLVSLYGDLTVRENIELCADFYGLSKDIKNKRANDLLELVDIRYAENKLVKQLSGGQRQKVSLVASLIHQPELLFLDEPTIGLDPPTKKVLWELIEELNQEGRTIILCSHDMYEVELLCDDVGIIDTGKLAAFDTPQSLKDTLIKENNSVNGNIGSIIKELEEESINKTPIEKLKTAIFQYEKGNSKEISLMISNLNEDLLKKLENHPYVYEIRKNESGRITLDINASEDSITEIIATVIKNDGIISSIWTEEPSLEDVFVSVTAKNEVEGE
jgi:ABC-2 type transport system ATP-binding protein